MGAAARSALASAGRAANEAVSFVVFLLLDALEALLCVAYRVADYVAEGAWRPCYCARPSPASSSGPAGGKIVVSERGGSKVVSMLSATRLHLEDISDTLYARRRSVLAVAGAAFSSPRRAAAGVTVHSAPIVQMMLRGKAGGDGSNKYPSPRWSDCHCANCNPADTGRLFVHVEAPPAGDGGVATEEDVLFIHGFISSSGFWTQTVLPHVSPEARSRRRLFAVDLLGFGRSPKPADSLYTLREHVEMIERSVIERHGVKSFHIVAHSLGSILALALAVRYPAAVKSLTLVAPVRVVFSTSSHSACALSVSLSDASASANAAVLPGAARGGRHAVRAADGGAAAGVAGHRVRRLRGLLVRAPQPHRQHRALQAPPPLGARLPRLHPLQVRRSRTWMK